MPRENQHRLSVDVPKDLYETVTRDLNHGNLKQMVVNFLQQVAIQTRQGQRFLRADIAAGKRFHIDVKG